MNHWEYLMDVPEEIRATMSAAFVSWQKQDLGVEAMVDGMIQAPTVTRTTVQWLQSSANSVRVPELCRKVHAAHPVHPGTKRTLSNRDVFKAVALFCGLHHKRVQDLVYGRKEGK